MRDALGIKAGDKLSVALHGKRIILSPAVPPPEEALVKASPETVREILCKTHYVDERKTQRLLRALGVQD